MSTIMPAFDRFSKEGVLIGRLLVGYGELELGLCFCVAEARDDFNMVFKAMFRPRGETQRIGIADAMGREKFRDVKLGTHFEEAIGAIRYCLKIRNQFAHCYWTDDFGRQLGFVELEETAKDNKRVDNVYHIKASDIDLPTLQSQEAYFLYIRVCLDFLTSEFKVRAGKSPRNPFEVPKKVTRPPLCKP